MRQTRGRGSDGIELNLGNGQVVAFVLVALALLGLTFALGVKVGQQIGADQAAADAEAQVQDRLAALDARASASARPSGLEPAGNAVDAAGRSTAEALTFAQELTRPPNREALSTPAAAPARAPEQKPLPVPSAALPGVAAASQAEPAVSAPKLADASPAQERGNLLAAFEKVSAPGRSGFALQVASLPNARAAQDEVKRLASKGLSAWIRPAVVKGSTYYRVKVGPYATKADAQAALDGVAQASGARPIVVNAD